MNIYIYTFPIGYSLLAIPHCLIICVCMCAVHTIALIVHYKGHTMHHILFVHEPMYTTYCTLQGNGQDNKIPV